MNLRDLHLDTVIKPPCRVATTASITLSGLQTIDGEVLASGDRVLVRAQTDAAQNGIYFASADAWERAPDFNGPYDVITGTLVYVWSGVLMWGWHDITTADPAVGSTTIDWRRQIWPEPRYGGMYANAVSDLLMVAQSSAAAVLAAAGEAIADAGGLPGHEFLIAVASDVQAIGATESRAAFASVGVAVVDAWT